MVLGQDVLGVGMAHEKIVLLFDRGSRVQASEGAGRERRKHKTQAREGISYQWSARPRAEPQPPATRKEARAEATHQVPHIVGPDRRRGRAGDEAAGQTRRLVAEADREHVLLQRAARELPRLARRGVDKVLRHLARHGEQHRRAWVVRGWWWCTTGVRRRRRN